MLLIQVKRSRRGTAVVVIDPGGDAHACADPDELWDTVQDLLKEDFGDVTADRLPALPAAGGERRRQSPEPSRAIVKRRPEPQRVHVEEVPPEDEGDGINPFDAVMLSFVGEHGAQIASGAMKTLRNMSHRGSAKTKRRRAK